MFAGGCRDNTAAPIRIVLGPTAADEVTLVPRASLAELIEISETESALFLTLTSAERTCEALPKPDPENVGVSLRSGPAGEQQARAGQLPDRDASQSADKPHVLSTVKLHGRRQELRPAESSR
jgi:hypothetical protein